MESRYSQAPDESRSTFSGVARSSTGVEVQVVDTDVHPSPRSNEELLKYLGGEAAELPAAAFDAIETPIYVAPNKAQRLDSYSPAGGPPCSDPEFVEKQLLREAGVDYAIMLPLTARPMANPDHEAALCRATNRWLADTWLSRYNSHQRYRGAIRVCSTDASLAATEIRAWRGDRRFVEVMLVPYTFAPLGQQQHWPIYEAATECDLPIAVHVNRAPGARLLTPVGYSSYFIEHHALYPLLYATHLASMVFEGVFERFPTLRVAFVEGGFSWLVPFMWRLDQFWYRLRSEVPNVSRPPSEYIRERVRFTTQPFEEPDQPSDLLTVFDHAPANELLMFSTDYPHWDFDDPQWVLRKLREEERQRILRDNALEFYGLPSVRPA